MLVCGEAGGLPLESVVSFDNGAQLERLWSRKSEFTFVNKSAVLDSGVAER